MDPQNIPSVGDIFLAVATAGHLTEALKLIIEQNFYRAELFLDANLRHEGNTILQCACNRKKRAIEVVHRILAKAKSVGVDLAPLIDFVDRTKNSKPAIQIAAEREDYELVELLLHNGADIRLLPKLDRFPGWGNVVIEYFNALSKKQKDDAGTCSAPPPRVLLQQLSQEDSSGEPGNRGATLDEYLNKDVPIMGRGKCLDLLHVILQRPDPNCPDLRPKDDKNSYIQSGEKNGLALILNVVQFDGASENKCNNLLRRDGSEKDVDYLTDLLLQLNYQVRPLLEEKRRSKTMTQEEMQGHITNFISEVRVAHPESIFVFIGSHGLHNRIYTSDFTTNKNRYQSLHIYQDIINKFSDDNCKVLQGKPKIFLIQACQNFPEILVEFHSNSKENYNMRDMLICTAATPGSPAYRSERIGSWLPYCFTASAMSHVLMNKSLQEILSMVISILKGIKGKDKLNEELKQIPIITLIDFKTFYFSGGNGDYTLRVPLEVHEFMSDNDHKHKTCILRTLNNQFTCKKLEEANLLNVNFCEWKDWRNLSEDDTSRTIIVRNCTSENLKTGEWDEVKNKIIFVTSDPEFKFTELISSKGSIIVDSMPDLYQTNFLQRLRLKYGEEFPELGELTAEVLEDALGGGKPFRDQPKRSSCYIDRVLLSRNIISDEIFQQGFKPKVTFVISGMEQDRFNELSLKLRSSYDQDEAGLETGENSPTLLRLDPKNSKDNFENICNREKDTDVHLLEFESSCNGEGKLRWIKSRGDVTIFHRHVIKDQEELNEEDFCLGLISNSQSGDPICIFGVPGMGKSALLSQIGRRLVKLFPNRIVLFLSVQEFFKLLPGPLKVTEDMIKSALKKVVCRNWLGKAVLELKLKSKVISIELLLDGFDEIESEDIGYGILKTISSFETIRMWVTSRPDFMLNLEGKLNILGYIIKPFNIFDQVQLLGSFWSRNPKLNLDHERVNEFAQNCISFFKLGANEICYDFCATPLQAVLMAEILEEDVLEYAREGNNFPLADILITDSLTKFHQNVVNRKIQKYKSPSSGSEPDILKMLWRQSLQSMFPDECKRLYPLLSPMDTNTDVLEKVGLFEIKNMFSATHSTFPHYFVASFIVESSETGTDLLNQFLWEEVLKTEHRTGHQQFIHHNICYFVNSIILHKTTSESTSWTWDPLSPLRPINQIKDVAHACGHAGFYNILKYLDLMKAIPKQDHIYTDELLINVFKCPSLDLVNLVTDHYMDVHHSIELNLQIKLLLCSIEKGHCETVKFLLEDTRFDQIVKQDDNLLLRECRRHIKGITEEEIKQRIQIMVLLVNLNPTVFEEKKFSQSFQVEPTNLSSLFMAIAGVKPDLFGQAGNVLHLVLHDDLSPQDYDTFTKSIPIESLKIMVKGAGVNWDTALMKFIKWIDPLPETFAEFRKASADFNSLDKEGLSILANAVKFGRNKQTLRELIDHGANVGWKSGNGDTLFHQGGQYGNLEALQFLLDMSHDQSDVLSVENKEGFTPLDSVIVSDFKLGKRFDFGLALMRQGCKSNIIISKVNPDQSPLQHALKTGNLESVWLLLHLAESLTDMDDRGSKEVVAEPEPVKLSNIQVELGNIMMLKSKKSVNCRWTPELAIVELISLIENGSESTEHDFNSLLQKYSEHGVELNFDSRGKVDKNSLLHVAAKEQNLVAMRFLLSQSTDPIDWKNANEQTPLHLAALGKDKDLSFEVIKCIIDDGANAKLQDVEGLTFLHHYICQHQPPTPSQFQALAVYLDEQYSSDVFDIMGEGLHGTPLQQAVFKLEPMKDTLSLLKESNVHFTLINKEGDSILSYAIWGGRTTEFIKMLITDFGVDQAYRDRKLSSMLHVSALFGSTDTLKYFLDLNIKLGKLDVDGQDNDGDTPLHCALQQESREGILAKCELLVEYGASAGIKNARGDTPLEIATRQDDVDSELVRVLKEQKSTKSRTEMEDFLRFVETLDIRLEGSVEWGPTNTDIDADKSYTLPYAGQRGFALLLNIAEFHKDENCQYYRYGSERDLCCLTDLLIQLDYRLYPTDKHKRQQRSKSLGEMEMFIREFKEACNQLKPKSIIVFIGTDVYGKDNEPTPTSNFYYFKDKIDKGRQVLDLLNDVVNKFTEFEVPKIFLVEANQTVSRTLVESFKDTLICTAKPKSGTRASRDKFNGPWFIRCFTYFMMKYALNTKSLQEILRMVGRMLGQLPGNKDEEQIIQTAHPEFQELYFTGSDDDMSHSKKYIALPPGLQEIINEGSRICVIGTIDCQITLDKLRDNLEHCYYHVDEEEYEKLSPSEKSQDAVHIVNVPTLEQLTSTLNKFMKGSVSCKLIILVTSRAEQEIREHCHGKYDFLSDDIKWDHLSENYRHKLIEELDNRLGIKIPENTLQGELLLDIINRRKTYLNSFPEQPSFYIERRFDARDFIISKDIFKSTSNDIFFIQGISRKDLDYLAKGKGVGSISDLPKKDSIDDKFYVLDDVRDFYTVSERAQEDIVNSFHMLRKEKEKLMWMESKGKMDGVQKHMGTLNLGEERFFSSIISNSIQVVGISGDPGMGKSVLLARIGRRLRMMFPVKPVLFVELGKLLKQLKVSVTLEAALVDSTCATVLGKYVLRTHLHGRGCQEIELLLDSYDDLSKTEAKVAVDVIHQIKSSFKSVRIWLTASAQGMDVLHSKLNVIGHELTPFSPQEQVQFLINLWSEGQLLNEDKLKEFANHCLQTIRNILGIDLKRDPLQCRVLGEMYSAAAVEYAQSESTFSDLIPIQISSIATLLQNIIDRKIGKYCPELNTELSHEQGKATLGESSSSKGEAILDVKSIMEMLASLSVELIFPKEFVKLKGSLCPVNAELIMKLGFIESPSRRCIQQMYAGFLVSWVLTEKMTNEEGGNWNNELNEFLLGEVFNVKAGFRVDYSKFSHQLICSFFSSALMNFKESIPPKVLGLINNSAKPRENLKAIAFACGFADFTGIFQLLRDAMSLKAYKDSIYCKEFLLLTIKHSCLELVRLVVDEFEKHHKFGEDLQNEALRFAVVNGLYSAVEFLINDKGLGMTTPLLLHDCVKDSKHMEESKIQKKMSIIELLLWVDSTRLKERDAEGRTPLISKGAHVELLLELIRLGANVMAEAEHGHTVLHWNDLSSSTDYNKLVEFICEQQNENLRDLVKGGVGSGGPLTDIIKHMDPLPKTLDIFANAGADFNFVDELGYSVLGLAVKHHRKITTLRDLIKHGAKTTHLTGSGENLIHIAVEEGNIAAVEFFATGKYNLDMNAMDGEGQSPLELAMKCTLSDRENSFELCLALVEYGEKLERVLELKDASLSETLYTAAMGGNLQSLLVLLYFFGMPLKPWKLTGPKFAKTEVKVDGYPLLYNAICQFVADRHSALDTLRRIRMTTRRFEKISVWEDEAALEMSGMVLPSEFPWSVKW